jgi:hypothetical protein
MARMTDTTQPTVPSRSRRTPAELEAEMRKRIEALRLRRVRKMYRTAEGARILMHELAAEAAELKHPSLSAVQSALRAVENAALALAEGKE